MQLNDKFAKSSKHQCPKNVAKYEKRGIFQEKQHKSRKQDKTGKAGKYEKQESKKKRKIKERKNKEKKGKYVHSWVTYSHRSPSQVTC